MTTEKFLPKVYRTSIISLSSISIILLIGNLYLICLSFAIGAILGILLLKVNELTVNQLLNSKSKKTLLKIFVLKYPLMVAILYYITQYELNFLVLCFGVFLPYFIIFINALFSTSNRDGVRF